MYLFRLTPNKRRPRSRKTPTSILIKTLWPPTQNRATSPSLKLMAAKRKFPAPTTSLNVQKSHQSLPLQPRLIQPSRKKKPSQSPLAQPLPNLQTHQIRQRICPKKSPRSQNKLKTPSQSRTTAKRRTSIPLTKNRPRRKNRYLHFVQQEI